MSSIYSCPVWVTEVVWLASLRYKQKAVAQQTLPLCPKHRLENQLQRRDTSTLIELRQENVRTLGDMEITSDTCQFVAIQGLWKGAAKALLWDSCSQSVGVTDTGPWLSKGKSCHSYGCVNTVWWNRLTATKSNTFAWKDIIGGYMDCFKVKWCQLQVQWCAMFDVKVMPNKKPSNIVKKNEQSPCSVRPKPWSETGLKIPVHTIHRDEYSMSQTTATKPKGFLLNPQSVDICCIWVNHSSLYGGPH